MTDHNIPRVKAEHLGHGFPGAPLLFEDVDFEATAGDVLGLCGPSGSGKSTLLSIAAGWEKPRIGQFTREGVKRVNWVFQNPHGVAHRSALDHVVLPFLAAGLGRREAEDKALPIMESFRLTAVADRAFRELSGGEAQRLMLARAVASGPDLLLVDEPTAQLDLRTSQTVNETLSVIAQAGAIVLIATHDPGTRDACSHVVQLEEYTPTTTEVLT